MRNRKLLAGAVLPLFLLAACAEPTTVPAQEDAPRHVDIKVSSTCPKDVEIAVATANTSSRIVDSGTDADGKTWVTMRVTLKTKEEIAAELRAKAEEVLED